MTGVIGGSAAQGYAGRNGKRPAPRGEEPRRRTGSGRSSMMYHQHIMRTTIDLPDHLLVDAKKIAAERHVPLTRLLEESLRAYLGEQRLRSREPIDPLPVLTEARPVTDLDLDDTSRLWEIE